jgi:predicted deacylase
MSSAFAHATIGTPGQPWGPEEVAQWRARQVRQRSHADDVLAALAGLDAQWQREPYGELVYGSRRYPLHALRSKDWQDHRPTVLVTGGVHGYETSGVHGALRFAREHAARYAGRVNLLVVPCVSPWGYEHIQRWNHDAIDPNRSVPRAQPGAGSSGAHAPGGAAARAVRRAH